MKEITRIHLARTPYNIEVDAKKQLDRYLLAIKTNMQADDEMLNEIETRMVELLSDRHVKNDSTITAQDVGHLRQQLGEPSDFIEDPTERVVNPITLQDQHIYRDEQNAWLGGVAAGVAARMGLNVWLIRAILVALAFASFGLVVMIYILAWVLIPPARSAAQRLEMTGRPVTLGALSENEDGVVDRSDPSSRPFVVILRVIMTIICLAVAAGAIAGMVILSSILLMNANILMDTKESSFIAIVMGLAAFGLLLLAALAILLSYSAAAWKMTRRMAVTAAIIIVSGLTIAAIGLSTFVLRTPLTSYGTANYYAHEDRIEELRGVSRLKLESADGIRVNYYETANASDYSIEADSSPIGIKSFVEIERNKDLATVKINNKEDCWKIYGECIDQGYVNIHGPVLKDYEGKFNYYPLSQYQDITTEEEE